MFIFAFAILYGGKLGYTHGVTAEGFDARDKPYGFLDITCKSMFCMDGFPWKLL